MTATQWVALFGPVLAIIVSRLLSHKEHKDVAATINRIEINTNDRLSKALGKVDLLEQQVRSLTAVLSRHIPQSDFPK